MKSSMNLSSRNRQEHQNKMDKQQSSTGICRNLYWLVIFASFGLWFFLFCFNSSIYISGKDKIHSFMTDYVYPVMSSSSSSQSNPVLNETQTHSSTTNPIKPIIDLVDPKENSQQEPLNVEIEDDPCSNKYIYVHNLPPRFNDDLIKQCKTLYIWSDLCPFMMNSGLGPIMENSDGVFSDKGWFATNQFTLEVIFHNRMKSYKCLTNNSSLASAIFVPFYSGLDIFRYLWGFNSTMKDLVSLDLMKWLKDRPEWEVLDGRDHFLIAGRITWDYRRVTDDDSDWGNKLMVLPEARNMSVLTIEASPWHRNDFAIPYPTYFHPSSDNEVYEWQNRMRRHKKRYLFSFAGAPRPNITGSIRNDIINQCVESNKTCEFLDCRKGTCELPSKVMKLFQDSFFCLQPPGDSSTRRSAFDSILAGCIPVFFHPGSAYTQYMWHLPKDYKKYSVFISEYDVRKGNVSIESVLKQIPEEKVRAMREEVIKLIPKMVYADPRSKLENTEDAFDIAVNGVLERVKKVRKDMNEGRNPDEPPYLEDNTWKYTLFGTEKKHEWDIFFDTRRN